MCNYYKVVGTLVVGEITVSDLAKIHLCGDDLLMMNIPHYWQPSTVSDDTANVFHAFKENTPAFTLDDIKNKI